MRKTARTTTGRRVLMARARQVLWKLIRDRARALERSALRRRLRQLLPRLTSSPLAPLLGPPRGLLPRLSSSRLAAVLRRGALAGALAAALLAPGRAAGQGIELA